MRMIDGKENSVIVLFATADAVATDRSTAVVAISAVVADPELCRSARQSIVIIIRIIVVDPDRRFRCSAISLLLLLLLQSASTD